LSQIIRQRLPYHWRKHRHLPRVRRLVPAILRSLPAEPGTQTPATWVAQHVQWTETQVAVVAVGPVSGTPRAFVKLPATSTGVERLRKQVEVQQRLHADPRLASWCALVPRQLGQGTIDGRQYVVEQAMVGQEATPLLADPERRADLLLSAAVAIGGLHRATGRQTQVDTPLLRRWIDERLPRPCTAMTSLRLEGARSGAIDRLQAELRGALHNRRVEVSWIHGDYWPGNILVTPDGKAVAGIIDWDHADDDELSLQDVIYLLLYSRCLQHRRDLGEIICELLNGARWTDTEQAVMDTARDAVSGERIGDRTLICLCWLRHVDGYLRHTGRSTRDREWVQKNVANVVANF
jgi:hypothetical protein